MGLMVSFVRQFVLNNHKDLKCLYDNHLIDWCEKCPKNMANLHLENLKEQIKNLYKEEEYEET